jgi:ribosome biogenesis SPOUT family RNA methylase Rps3
MLSLAGPQSTVSFTHLSQAASTELTAAFSSTISSADSKAKAYVTTDSVSDMMQKEGVSLDRVCLLDPQAKDQLVPEDADGGFEWFLFGVRVSACRSIGLRR